MKGLVVKRGSAHVGEKCVLCPRLIKPEEAILVETITEIRFGSGRTRRYHKRCLAGLLDRAPDGIDEFLVLRGRMAEAQDAFV